MRAYVISTVGNSNFANIVLNDISPTKTYYSPDAMENKNFGNKLHRYLRKCDIYIAVIDSNIINNNFLLLQLRYAKDYAQKHSNKLFIPIILDNSKVPISLEGIDFYTYDTKTQEKSYSGDLPGHTSLNEKIKYLLLKRSRPALIQPILFTLEIFVIILVTSLPSVQNSEEISFLIVMISLFAFLISAPILIMNNQFEKDKKEEVEHYSQRLNEIIIIDENKCSQEENNEKEKSYVDALKLMRSNLKDINEYYTWSKTQAKITFWVAIIMCISGFFLIIAAVIIQFLKEPNIMVSIFAAIGGIITEFISGTIFVIYRHSLSQLNHYHKALHEDERFLSNVNLAVHFSSEELKDEMLKEIIQGEIQMNLENTKETNKDNVDKLIQLKRVHKG